MIQGDVPNNPQESPIGLTERTTERTTEEEMENVFLYMLNT
jgi:hypothetical protein